MSQVEELLDVGAFLSKEFKGQARRGLKFQPVLLPAELKEFLLLFIEKGRFILILAGMTKRDLDSQDGLLLPKWGNLDLSYFKYTNINIT